MLLDLVVVGLVAFYLLARLGRRAKLLGALEDIYEISRRYGDLIHVAYGMFTARILELGLRSGAPAEALVTSASALIMFLAYVAYQYAQRDENVPKDIAVYTASFAVALGASFGIPFKIPLLSSA